MDGIASFPPDRPVKREVLMITRKTLEQAKAEKGYFDKEKFDSFTDADIERMIDEDPDLAPRTETLQPLLEARIIRRKLGLTQPQFAKKLGVPVATVRVWERAETPVDPVLQALLRILDRMPKSALRALDQTARKAG
jgi:putative transcriptional regulator